MGTYQRSLFGSERVSESLIKSLRQRGVPYFQIRKIYHNKTWKIKQGETALCFF